MWAVLMGLKLLNHDKKMTKNKESRQKREVPLRVLVCKQRLPRWIFLISIGKSIDGNFPYTPRELDKCTLFQKQTTYQRIQIF